LDGESGYQKQKTSKQYYNIANHSTSNLSTSNHSTSNITNIINPWEVTGWADSEGSFIVKIFKKSSSRLGWQVQVCFEINLHQKDLNILNIIKQFFGNIGGSILNRNTNKISRFVVASLDDILNIIIPHFDKYPLLTQKRADYILFKEVALIIKEGQHLTQKGLQEIVNKRASINWGLSDSLKKDFPQTKPVTRPNISNENEISPSWVAAFTGGEGCFSVNIKNNKTLKLNYSVELAFDLTQHVRDEHIIKSFIAYFGCGQVYINRDCFRYHVGNLKDILEKIIPFYLKNNIIGVKRNDFIDWCTIAKIMQEKKHLTPEGLSLIIKIKQGINTKRLS
jgi:hypothetical protein